uniref:PH domain-containing protein n=1 Tax=Anopheles maculatus TaxID=74869 RepID=A0A182SBY6_9DIPT
YIKPYRLPSKKRILPYRWGESLPSPRVTDTFALQDFSLPLDRVPEKHAPSDTESDGSDILTPTDAKETEKEIRLYLPKPRAVLQRRHTLSSFKDLVGVSSWRDERKGKPLLSSELQSLRDKSVSFGFGLEMSPRPTTTCLGLVGGGAVVDGGSMGVAGSVPAKCSSFGGLKSSLPDIVPQEIECAAVPPNDRSIVGAKPGGGGGGGGSREQVDSEAYKAGVSKVVRFESSSKADQCHVDTKYTCQVDSTVLETFEPIPYVDEDLPPVVSPPTVTERVKRFESFATRMTPAPSTLANGQHTGSTTLGVGGHTVAPTSKPIPMQRQLAKDPEVAEAINTVVVNRELVKRGRLDKSYSTPAYDDELSDVPPAIEPRKEHLLKAPPVPPPRPKRTLEPIGGPVPEKPPLTPTAPVPSKATVVAIVHLPETASGFVSSLSNTLDSREDSANKSKLANVIDLKQNRTQPLVPPMAPGTVTPPKPAERTAPIPPIPASRPAAAIPATKLGPSNEIMSIPPTVNSSAVPSIPTDTSSELLTPNKTKSLTLKKKNSLLSKRRKVSLKTLCVSDIQGHLYRRTKDRSGMSYWARYYFVLIDTTLYGFNRKESTKANCMIFLSGFTISLAKEVHSRPHAFKVYHPSKTFYFAAETQEALVQWMEYIRQATLKGAASLIAGEPADHHSSRELFTETDSSDDELGLMDSTTKLNLLCTPSPQTTSGASSSHGATAGPDGTPTSSKQDNRYHLNFGSLKKFTKIGSDASHHGSSGGSKNANGTGSGNASSHSGASTSGPTSEGSKFFGFFSSHRNVEKSNSSEMPVPTSQFKSYRKVPGAGGLQIGTASASTEAFPLSVATIADAISMSGTGGGEGENFSISMLSLVSSASEKATAVAAPPQPPPRTATPTPPPVVIREPATPTLLADAEQLLNQARKSKRISPHNYIHASNPNLVEFDFQTSKAMDFSVPKIHSGNTWDSSTHSHSNLQSMITLKDLMLQKQAEEAQDMYNKRVCLGVEKLDDRKGRMMMMGGMVGVGGAEQQAHSQPANAAPAIPEAVNKIQRRQLPITPDYAQSFKLDDEDILYTRSKEGQKLRDFGYEMISGDDAFDQRNKPTRSTVVGTTSGMGSGVNNGGAGGSGSNGTNGGTTAGTSGSSGGGGGGSIKKKTFNWINSDRKAAASAGGDATSHPDGSLAIGSATSSSSLFST